MPAWIALRSCTIASMQSVCTAPGKRSLSLFSPVKTGQREIIAREGFVDAQHLLGLGERFALGLVRGVAFLPEELGGAQEDARPHFPADDVGPLVDEDRQVAIALDPLRVARADDRLAGGPDDERLGRARRRRGTQSALAVRSRAGDA